MPKIKTVKLDLLNKKDLNKFLKSKEFKESKIVEELIESLENCLAEEEYLRLLINYREWGKE